MKPGSCALPCYGIEFAVLDATVGVTISLLLLLLLLLLLFFEFFSFIVFIFVCFYVFGYLGMQTGRELSGNGVEGVLCIKNVFPSIGNLQYSLPLSLSRVYRIVIVIVIIYFL